MKAILIGVFVLILATAAILVGWHYYLRWTFRKIVMLKYAVVKPLIQKLAVRDSVTSAEILVIVRDPTLRLAAYRVLDAFNRSDLFPAEFLTIEKGAESFLVTWLEFPTELGQAPHEILFLTTVALQELADMTYYVFKYSVKGKPGFAENDWMLGVVGPYRNESEPYDIPPRVFSRFYSVDRISAEEEVKWVHENVLVNKKKV